MTLQNRLDAVRKEIESRRLDAHLITVILNVRYVTGFTGSTGTAIVTPNRTFMLVDPRYTLQASAECPLFEIREYTGDPMVAAATVLNEIGAAKIGFEESGISHAHYCILAENLSGEKELIHAGKILETLRMVKDTDEIELISRAVDISDVTFVELLGWLKPGMKETDVALKIEISLRQNGAERSSFETIVASGPHAALPHAQPGEALTETGQLLKLDYGALYKQYPSDITRTVVFGKATDKQKEIYQIVLDAQLRAIEAIKPGVAGKDIDAVARNYITEKGYGNNFGHGLGHSLGLAVHDGPGLSRLSDTILAPGMVMTVEPGIYIEGWGGIRIEDDIVVTESGCEILNKSPKMELIELSG